MSRDACYRSHRRRSATDWSSRRHRLTSSSPGTRTARSMDYQAAALTMAIYLNGMADAELLSWTEAMLRSGEVLDLSDIKGVKVDKHSTGGVGDTISLMLAPLVAAAGVPVPMISGRGLGHTGGTLDKLESIPGFRTDLTVDPIPRAGRYTLGLGLIGQTGEIAPADKKLYALRDATSTVESIPLIASSIMSKKLAEGIDGLVLDVKVGSGAFMKDFDRARKLAETMLAIGKGAGKKVTALLTEMSQPLGRYVGNSLEVIEACETLRGEGPADMRELTLELGAEMLLLAGQETDLNSARTRLAGLLDDGSAFRRFEEIVEAQHGDPRALTDHSLLPTAQSTIEVFAARPGYVSGFTGVDVGRAAALLGAGRARKEDPVDPAVGVIVHRKIGDEVGPDIPLATFHYNGDENLKRATEILVGSVQISDEPVSEPKLFLDRLTTE